MTLADQLNHISNRDGSSAGLTGVITAVNATLNTVSVNFGDGNPVDNILLFATYYTPAIGDYVVVIKSGDYFLATPRKPRSILRSGTITAINSSAGTCSVTISGGITLTGIPYIFSIEMYVGSRVMLGPWGSSYIVLGTVNGTTIPAPPSNPETEFPTIEWGETICPAVSSWQGIKNRSTSAWTWRNDSGATLGTFSSADHVGAFRFDLSEIPSSVSVVSIKLGLTIRPVYFQDDVTVRVQVSPHNYSSIPSGAPTWDSRAVTSTLTGKYTTGNVGIENLNKSYASIDLPASWLTDLIAGTVKGIGIRPEASTAGYGAITIVPQITIGWKRNL